MGLPVSPAVGSPMPPPASPHFRFVLCPPPYPPTARLKSQCVVTCFSSSYTDLQPCENPYVGVSTPGPQNVAVLKGLSKADPPTTLRTAAGCAAAGRWKRAQCPR